MKIDAGSSASFASLAALAVPAFLVWAALAASFAAAAASSFDFAADLAVVDLGPQVRGLGGGLLLEVLGPRLDLVRPGGGEHPVGVSELGVGAGLEPLQ